MEPAIPSLTLSVPGGTLGMVICLLHVAVWNLSVRCELGVPSLLVSFYPHHSTPRCLWTSPPPSGFHDKATAQLSAGSFLNMWSLQFHLIRGIYSLMLDVSFISSIVRFDRCCCHLTLWIFLRHFVWKESIFFFSIFLSFHISHPYTNTEITRLLKKRDVELFAIIFLMSVVAPSSLVTLAPRHVKLSTSSTLLFLTFRMTSLLVLTFQHFEYHPAANRRKLIIKLQT